MCRFFLILMNLIFSKTSSLNKDLLCVVERDDRSCEASSGSLHLRVPSIDNETAAMFRTHSIYALLTYLYHLHKNVLLIDCSKPYLCENLDRYGYDIIFESESEGYSPTINLKKEKGKYFVDEYRFLSFFECLQVEETLPTIILSNLLSIETYKGFITELKYLSSGLFNVQYQARARQKYEKLKEENNFFVMYNTFHCEDILILTSCDSTKIQIEIFKDLSSVEVLCKFSNDLLQQKNKIIDTRQNDKSFDRSIVFKYILKFCKTLLFIIYNEEEMKNNQESEIEDIIYSLARFGVQLIKINRNDFVTSLPIHFNFSDFNQQMSMTLVFCGAIINKCHILAVDILSLNKESIRNNVEEQIMHYINQVHYKDFQLIEAREKLLCYDIIGDCYDIFKYVNLQIFYEYQDHHEEQTYYRMKKAVVVKVYYMIWSVISLRTLWLYESLLSNAKSSSILTYLGLDMRDVQLIRVNCLQMNEECNEEEIVEYPTIKIIYPKRNKNRFVYKNDPLDTAQLIQFFINCAINPFFYSSWKSGDDLFFNIIGEYYENIIIVGLWQNLQLQVQTNVQKLLSLIDRDYLLVVIDVLQAPAFLKEKLFLDLQSNPGVYLVNIHHSIASKINVDKDFENSLLDLKKTSISMLTQLNFKRAQMAKEIGIPIFVVFYYVMNNNLSTALLQSYYSFFNDFSFNHINIWQNYRMFQLFQSYKCKTIPCFSVFNYSAGTYTFYESWSDPSYLQLWIQSILRGFISPNVILERLPTLEFYHKFDYSDSFVIKKSTFGSQNSKNEEKREKFNDNEAYREL